MTIATEPALEIIKEYKYEPKLKSIIWFILIFGVLTGVMISMALDYSNGERVDGGIFLKILNATGSLAPYLCWISVVFMALVTLFAIFQLFQRLFFPQRVALTPTDLLIPKSTFSTQELRIPYASITSLQLTKVNITAGTIYFMSLSCPAGDKRIAHKYFSSVKEFNEMLALVADKVPPASVKPPA